MTHPLDPADSQTYALRRVRHEPRRRTLRVEAVERLSPGMLRLVFRSPDLADFPSQSPDDHVKVMLPTADGGMIMRDYTPRAFDREAGRLVIDFAIHDAGPVTAWALAAKVGDQLIVGGPRGSAILPDNLDWLCLIGDETALPAIGRTIEEARPGARIVSLVIVESQADIQTFETKAEWSPHWIARDQTQLSDEAALIERLEAILPKFDRGFVWLAAEAQVARALRAHLAGPVGLPLNQIKASGYWVKGAEGAHERLD